MTIQRAGGRALVASMPPLGKPVISREDAEELCRRGARLAAALNGAIAARDTAVVAAGDVNKDRIARLTGEVVEIDLALENWANAHREEFAGLQELPMKAGILKFRLGGRYVDLLEPCQDEKTKKEGFAKILSTLIRAGRVLAAWRDWVKVDFKFDLRKILSDSAGEKPKLTAAKLEAAGMAIRQNENFTVEYNVNAKP